MQEYLNVATLIVNFIAVLYLVIKSSFRKKMDYQQELSLKMLSNQEKLMRQLTDIKTTIEHHHMMTQRENEQWKAEMVQALNAVKIESDSNSKANNGQHLFLNDRYREVFDLKAKGLSVEEIAKQLGKGNGEVAFILQLAEQART
ncbi:helix-turn-helix domain-containing protein [Neobacillus drentensis]|uniref:helix-turn-helix domain-containing protein n=1 Tax=Neobacillus drentensis TaxID=220684 RepID=UPI0030007FBC